MNTTSNSYLKSYTFEICEIQKKNFRGTRYWFCFSDGWDHILSILDNFQI